MRRTSKICFATVCMALSCAATGSQSADLDDNNQAAPYLPFEMPSRSALYQSKKKVFAHYFSPFPISIDNKMPDEDYYECQYLTPDGENNKHIKYGGYLRQRPLPRDPLPDDDWEVRDLTTEVRRARDIGLDGFCFDILYTEKGLGLDNQRLEMLLSAAAAVDPNFKIMLMPDMFGEFKEKPGNFFTFLPKIADNPSLFRTAEGKVVVAPYCPTPQSADWWKTQMADMESKGIKIAFVPLFQAWQRYAEEFEPISVGFSDWGDNSNLGENFEGRKHSPQQCHALGKLWMSPVRPQDFRPMSFMSGEAENSSLFRTMWDTAITGDADWVQLVTWNDYAENTAIAPSTGVQFGFYDLSAYFTIWFKTGHAPKITKDALFYFYRSQTLALVPSKQENLFKMPNPSEEIETLAFLKEPGTLEVKIDGKTYHQDFPAGLNSFKAPSAVGRPVFRLIRRGETVIDLAGKWEIADKADYQDWLYRSGSSLREILNTSQK